MADLPYIGTTITGLSSNDSNDFELKVSKGAPNGYAPLDANSKVPTANLPDQASLDAEVDGKITTHNSATTSVHGIANTAELIHSTVIGPNTDKVVTFNQSGGNGNSVVVGPDKIQLDNGAKLKKGTTDGGLGGSKGIALSSANYELKWEAGRLYTMQNNGTTIRSVEHCMSAPTASDNITKGFVTGSRWIMEDGTIYECTNPNGGNTSGGTWVNGVPIPNSPDPAGVAHWVQHTKVSTKDGVYGETWVDEYWQTGGGGAGGSITLEGANAKVFDGWGVLGGSNAGKIDLSAKAVVVNGVNKDLHRGGRIISTGGAVDANSSDNGAFVDWSNAHENIPCRGGDLTMSGSSAGKGGDINTSAGENSGGSINTSNGGGSINTSGFNGGSINTSAGDGTGGGSIITSGGEGGDGGSINTSNGGGAINTRGTGSIQLGVTGTRTTLNGSASGSNKTITLPNATGTIALTSDPRFTDARNPTSHTHGNITNAGAIPQNNSVYSSISPQGTGYTNGSATINGASVTVGVNGSGGVTTLNGIYLNNPLGTYPIVQGSNASASVTITASFVANLPLITTTSGVVTTGTFGTTANSFCQGNDVRLGSQTIFTLGGEAKTTFELGKSYLYGCMPTRAPMALPSGSYLNAVLRILGNFTVTGISIHQYLPSAATADLTYRLVKVVDASNVTVLGGFNATITGNNNLTTATSSISASLNSGDQIGLMLTLGASGNVPSSAAATTVLANIYCVPR